MNIVLNDKSTLERQAPFNKYDHIFKAWHTGSHGINIKEVQAVENFIKDYEQSNLLWKQAGMHIGFIIQAVENNVIVNRGCPITLLSDISVEGEHEENQIHVNPQITWEVVDSYKQYLKEECFKDISLLEIEVKPFFLLNKEDIDYEVVSVESEEEQDFSI